ncbi:MULTISPECIES: hypothetical protein [Bacillus]|uniref:Uncharacterized protein n=1 Tax=Bacillus sonorensis TaxID=119858 RepID=A0ABN5ABB4_9BACI|nr:MULTISPECIES: hypothetical protein [Bacillus]ASB87377.1 hypothetical protein S101395_00823 [Bacillus sonorensis]MDI3409692.1 hypothetical protein [Bacillus sonorensis]MEC0340093.1 hypothetical protein [Bacillus sonorensis]MEC0425770.1 hypothetical protein [Bacillus sonorensis]MEC0458629.1 hypothetical protein [Bacillus sonorensis]
MGNPEEKIGKVCTSLEKYFDARAGKVRVKRRPVLIIGHEDDYESPTNIDFEILPISTMKKMKPHEKYDIPLEADLYKNVGLNEKSYIRAHKTTWNHIKHMGIEKPIGDLKDVDNEIFRKAVLLNETWVTSRTNKELNPEENSED